MDDPTSPDHAQRLARHLTAVSVTLDDLDITEAEVIDWTYEPPDVGHPAAVVEMDLTDGRTVSITKGTDGIPHVTWTHPEPDGTGATGPEASLAPPRSAQQPPAGIHGSPEGSQGRTGPRVHAYVWTNPATGERTAFDPAEIETVLDPLGLPVPGEPTSHIVVRTAADIPASVAGHAMYHHQNGVMRHARLGIYVIVLDEIDPDRHRARLLEVLGEAGVTREKLTKAEAEAARQRDLAELLRRARAELHVECDRLTAELAEVRAELRDRSQTCTRLDQLADQQRAEVERLRIVETASIGAHALLDDAQDEVQRLRKESVEDACEMKRMRGLLREALEGWRQCDTALCNDKYDEEPHDGEECQRARIAEIRREAGLS